MNTKQFSRMIKQVMQDPNRSRFTKNLTYDQAEALFRLWSPKMGIKRSKNRIRLWHKDGFVTFSLKQNHVHLLVSKHK